MSKIVIPSVGGHKILTRFYYVKAMSEREELTGEELELWRRDLLRRLDQLEHLARRARKQLEREEGHTLEDNADLKEAWQKIVDLFPEGFRPNRAGDLARHISFSMDVDFRDIVDFDLPEVRNSVERYQVKTEDRIRKVSSKFDLGFDAFEVVTPSIRDAVMDHFHAGDYALASRRTVELLMSELRKLSGLTDDGTKLINKAVGVQSGQVGFSDCESDSEKSITNGMKNVLSGLYSGVRNPCAHGWEDMTQFQCFQIISMCSFLLENMQIVSSK